MANKKENTLKVEINQFCDGKRDTMRSSYAIDKMGGVVTPPTSRKVGLYRTKQATFFARRNDFYALFATNKAKHILKRHFSCSCSDTIHSKSIKKNRKNPIF